MKVILNTVYDNVRGGYGLLPQGSEEFNFDPFYTDTGIFHDIFEHGALEGIDKYFLGDYAYNIGGEICAMGALTYYYFELGLSDRLNLMINDGQTVIINTTLYEMGESIVNGDFDFGNQLLCNVPNIRKIDNDTLNYIISKHYTQLKKYKPCESNYDEYIFELQKQYARSITKQKIHNLYTYGFRRASKIIVDNFHNLDKAHRFLVFWEEFCKKISAELLYNVCRKVEVNVKTGENMDWNIWFYLKEDYHKKIHHKYILKYLYDNYS